MRQPRARAASFFCLLLAGSLSAAEWSPKDAPASPDSAENVPSSSAWPANSAASSTQPAVDASSAAPASPSDLRDAPNSDASAASTSPVSSGASSSDSTRTEGSSRLLAPDAELIDMPTAAVIDYGSFSTRTRFFSNGGVLEWLSFGVFQRLNIGASLNVDKLLGTATPVQVTRPDLQLKFRFYDGTTILPALAVGFDGQGYMYNRIDHRYDQRQRGLYLVGSQEIGIPGLQANAGFNIPDFDSNPLAGFVGASYDIQDQVLLMAEWDNIDNWSDSRLNAGFRVYITPNFSTDFAVRTIGSGGIYTNGVQRGAERIVQLKYTGSF